MTICIIGWYGTETIGDRAILAGILSFLHKRFKGDLSVKLGSLYPFFSERTLIEDRPFYKEILDISEDLDIQVFDSRVPKQLDDALKQSDLLVLGGGPLMHINPMFMLEYAFAKAKKIGKKTMVFGCGVGPIRKKRHQRALIKTIRHSDQTVLRDQASLSALQRLAGKRLDKQQIRVSPDPSVQCLLDYKKLPNTNEVGESYIALNLRAFPAEYSSNKIGAAVNDNLVKFVTYLAEVNQETKVRLVPMHYFHIGNDDRDFLNRIAIEHTHKNLEVQNVPLSLKETIQVFEQAGQCIGMRFHSVVFQTMVNGKNLILDYTEPGKGKISGFLQNLDAATFYERRYVNLQEGHFDIESISGNLESLEPFTPDENLLKEQLSVYTDCLQNI